VSTDARPSGLEDDDGMEKDVVDKTVELAKTIDAGESELTPWLLLGQVSDDEPAPLDLEKNAIVDSI